MSQRSNLTMQVAQAKFVICPMRLPRCAEMTTYWWDAKQVYYDFNFSKLVI